MRITELKEKFDAFIAEKGKEQAETFSFTEYVNITEYIPISVKIDIAQKAAAELYTEVDGIRSVDYTAADIVKDLTVISLYTDIEYNEEETFEAYDVLTQMGFFDYLRDMDFEDIYRFRNILDNTLSMIVEEYNSLELVINRCMLRLENRLVASIDNFADKANIKPEELEQLKNSLKSINTTMDAVKDVKAVEVVEAFRES